MEANTRESHPPQSSMPDWRLRLSAAATEHEIVNVTRDYVAGWPLADIHALPEACRPGRIGAAEDISHWAYELARAHCSLRYNEHEDRLLMKMLAFISEAAVRMAEVKALEAAAARSP